MQTAYDTVADQAENPLREIANFVGRQMTNDFLALVRKLHHINGAKQGAAPEKKKTIQLDVDGYALSGRGGGVLHRSSQSQEPGRTRRSRGSTLRMIAEVTKTESRVAALVVVVALVVPAVAPGAPVAVVVPAVRVQVQDQPASLPEH